MDDNLVRFENGKVYVETRYLLELTDSPEFKNLSSAAEFSAMVNIAINALEQVVKLQARD